MMNRRFQFGPPPPPRDAEIIKRGTRLKIDLFRDKDGDIHGEFTISGGFGIYGEEDYGDDADAFHRQQADAMRFIKGLLGEFEKGRGDGSATG